MNWYCEMCDEWVKHSGACKACGYPLRPAEKRADDCPYCGSGWTFDFAQKRVTCKCVTEKR